MIRENKLIESKRNFAVVCAIGVIVIPALYLMGILSIGDVNMLGRFMTFAILALGLDLLWGYVGILSLCQFTFFVLEPMQWVCIWHIMEVLKGLSITTDGRSLPVCLWFIRMTSASPQEMHWFLVLETLLEPAFDEFLGLLIPGVASLVLGYFVFRSRLGDLFRHSHSSDCSRMLVGFLPK